MKEFIEMLKKIKPNVDFENEEALVDDGILESLDIISIISEIADKYGVVIPSDEIIPDNFNSAIALYELVELSLIHISEPRDGLLSRMPSSA